MAGDEDGGWAELATCPHGVQGNNVVLAEGGRGGEAGTVLSARSAFQPLPF